MANRLDIVIFGATGFTGKYCIRELFRLAKTKSLSWGVAGRSEKKLEATLAECQAKLNADLATVPIIIADVNNYESLVKMTAQAKVIINCCGPYRFFGEPVVKACVETSTHQVDVSGEPQFMESVQLNYHKPAQEKGVYIVSACGFDSIPADMGVVYLQKHFNGVLNSVETYLQASEESPKTPGPAGNYATWESAVHGIANAAELSVLRRKLFPTRLPNFMPKLLPRSFIHKSEVINEWCIPFLGSDRSVILRSQRSMYDNKKARPAQVHTYLSMGSILSTLLACFIGSVFTFLVKYEFGRSLLLKYPRFFSGGMFSTEPPSEKKMARTSFTITFIGTGWSEKATDIDEQFNSPPNKTVMSRVGGKDPGYGITASAIVLAAVVILTEPAKLPKGGGVYPPGAAFEDTSLIEQLQENGLKFEIVSEK